MDLLAFERKLDQTIMRKRLDIQEALKRPIKVGLCYISHSFSYFELNEKPCSGLYIAFSWTRIESLYVIGTSDVANRCCI